MIDHLGNGGDLSCVSRKSRNRDNFSIEFMDPDLSVGYKLFGLDDSSLFGQQERRL